MPDSESFEPNCDKSHMYDHIVIYLLIMLLFFFQVLKNLPYNLLQCIWYRVFVILHNSTSCSNLIQSLFGLKLRKLSLLRWITLILWVLTVCVSHGLDRSRVTKTDFNMCELNSSSSSMTNKMISGSDVDCFCKYSFLEMTCRISSIVLIDL